MAHDRRVQIANNFLQRGAEYATSHCLQRVYEQTVITLITLVWLLVAAVAGNAYAQHCYSPSTSPQFPGPCNYFADEECQQYQVGLSNVSLRS